MTCSLVKRVCRKRILIEFTHIYDSHDVKCTQQAGGRLSVSTCMACCSTWDSCYSPSESIRLRNIHQEPVTGSSSFSDCDCGIYQDPTPRFIFHYCLKDCRTPLQGETPPSRGNLPGLEVDETAWRFRPAVHGCEVSPSFSPSRWVHYARDYG